MAVGFIGLGGDGMAHWQRVVDACHAVTAVFRPVADSV
jgi:hypothetical protein